MKLDNIAANLQPYVDQFRKDYAEGKVELQDPKKIKK